MPHVLLFGCHRSVVQALAHRPGWTVAIGRHVDKRLQQDVPDPRQWNLIVDDCEKIGNTRIFGKEKEQEESLRVLRISVDAAYWDECKNAYGLRLCGEREHRYHRLERPKGHFTLEFHSVHDQAPHLMDFIEEFENRFRRGYLSHRPLDERSARQMFDTRPLFQDAYGNRLIELCRQQLDWLFCIDLVSAEARVEAILYLITRTIPKLWPQVYSDVFRPKRVVALLERQAEVIAQRRREVEEIEQQIQDELAFYAPYTALVVTGDDALKDLVAKAFADVFGGEVTDLDAGLGEGEQKTLDLLIRYARSSWFSEVRSRGDGNLREADLERFDANHGRAMERHGSADYKLIVFNGMYRRPTDVREKNPPFRSRHVVEEATDRGICLLSTHQLLAAIEAVRSGELSSEEFFQKLRRNGVDDLPGLAS